MEGGSVTVVGVTAILAFFAIFAIYITADIEQACAEAEAADTIGADAYPPGAVLGEPEAAAGADTYRPFDREAAL